MTKIQLANLQYLYMHDDCEGPHPLGTHRIVIQRNSAWDFLARLFALLLLIKAIYICLLNVISFILFHFSSLAFYTFPLILLFG